MLGQKTTPQTPNKPGNYPRATLPPTDKDIHSIKGEILSLVVKTEGGVPNISTPNTIALSQLTSEDLKAFKELLSEKLATLPSSERVKVIEELVCDLIPANREINLAQMNLILLLLGGKNEALPLDDFDNSLLNQKLGSLVMHSILNNRVDEAIPWARKILVHSKNSDSALSNLAKPIVSAIKIYIQDLFNTKFEKLHSENNFLASIRDYLLNKILAPNQCNRFLILPEIQSIAKTYLDASAGKLSSEYLLDEALAFNTAPYLTSRDLQCRIKYEIYNILESGDPVFLLKSETLNRLSDLRKSLPSDLSKDPLMQNNLNRRCLEILKLSGSDQFKAHISKRFKNDYEKALLLESRLSKLFSLALSLSSDAPLFYQEWGEGLELLINQYSDQIWRSSKLFIACVNFSILCKRQDLALSLLETLAERYITNLPEWSLEKESKTKPEKIGHDWLLTVEEARPKIAFIAAIASGHKFNALPDEYKELEWLESDLESIAENPLFITFGLTEQISDCLKAKEIDLNKIKENLEVLLALFSDSEEWSLELGNRDRVEDLKELIRVFEILEDPNPRNLYRALNYASLGFSILEGSLDFSILEGRDSTFRKGKDSTLKFDHTFDQASALLQSFIFEKASGFSLVSYLPSVDAMPLRHALAKFNFNLRWGEPEEIVDSLREVLNYSSDLSEEFPPDRRHKIYAVIWNALGRLYTKRGELDVLSLINEFCYRESLALETTCSDSEKLSQNMVTLFAVRSYALVNSAIFQLKTNRGKEEFAPKEAALFKDIEALIAECENLTKNKDEFNALNFELGALLTVKAIMLENRGGDSEEALNLRKRYFNDFKQGFDWGDKGLYDIDSLKKAFHTREILLEFSFFTMKLSRDAYHSGAYDTARALSEFAIIFFERLTSEKMQRKFHFMKKDLEWLVRSQDHCFKLIEDIKEIMNAKQKNRDLTHPSPTPAH